METIFIAAITLAVVYLGLCFWLARLITAITVVDFLANPAIMIFCGTVYIVFMAHSEYKKEKRWQSMIAATMHLIDLVVKLEYELRKDDHKLKEA